MNARITVSGLAGRPVAGSATSPAAIFRIVSAPSTASPNAQYWPSSRAVASRERPTNHWLPALSG